MDKPYFCERCGLRINHKGRCLPCNFLYKNKRYILGLKENPLYDKIYGLDSTFVSLLIENSRLKSEINKLKRAKS